MSLSDHFRCTYRAPGINLKVSARAVRRLIAEHEKAQKPAAAQPQEKLKS